uniref:Uncharacterized protein n=1 Tax=Anguilla anguilla TaxID=7936 RepID=A0A0E9TIT2_ANGAN
MKYRNPNQPHKPISSTPRTCFSPPPYKSFVSPLRRTLIPSLQFFSLVHSSKYNCVLCKFKLV